jgi:radical SAM superfamily enzyme YgiQ (UPF0313 family)
MNSRPLRIALISPKGPLYRRSGIFRKSLRYMPLTLPTLAALVPADLNAEVVCIDEGIDSIPEDLQADLVGMTVITGTAPRAYALASQFRRRGIPVVLGGPHVTLVPDDAQPHADGIVVGYAEQTWPQLLRDFVGGTLQPRYVQAPDFQLAGSPLPDRSVLTRRRYLTSHVFEATRGCVHNCSFCVVPSAWGRRPWQRPVDEVIADIRAEGARRLMFVDLNLIADRAYAQQLFEALAPLKVQWYGLATADLCDDLPLLDLVAHSGCRGLLMGLESISTNSLRRVGKGFNRPAEYAVVVERLHQRSIALQACFVFGLEEDMPGVFQETAEFAVEAHIDLPRYAIATPFPGTPFFQQLDSQQRILTRDWSLYDGQHVVFQPNNMTVDQLLRGTRQAWKWTYRWRNIARRLRRTAAPPLVALGSNLGYRFYAHHLDRYYTCDWPTHLAVATSRPYAKPSPLDGSPETQSREETYA